MVTGFYFGCEVHVTIYMYIDGTFVYYLTLSLHSSQMKIVLDVFNYWSTLYHMCCGTLKMGNNMTYLYSSETITITYNQIIAKLNCQ